MEYDPLSIPDKKPSDTPEAIQECLEYKVAIEQQLDDWCDTLNSSHPAVVIGGIAKIIVSNCTPKIRPVDDLEGGPFKTGLTPKEAERVAIKRKQLGLVATIAQDESFDSIDPKQLSDDVLDEYFERIMVFTQNHEIPQPSKYAVLYLRRIHRAQEQLSRELAPIKEAPSPNSKYVLLLNRIFNELY